MRYMYIYYFLVSRFSIRKVNFLSSDPVPQIVLDANVLMPIYSKDRNRLSLFDTL
jgi:hypothetical protein